MKAPLLPIALDRVARKYPENIAIKCAEQEINFRELNAKIDIIAYYLKLKIKPGEKVALLLDNSIQYVIASYAIWRAGGVLVGLNTALQVDELLQLLDHCDARALVLGKLNQTLLAKLDTNHSIHTLVTIFREEIEWPHDVWVEILNKYKLIEGSESISQQGDFGSDSQEAMIIYTSGTTSCPKGVLLSHRNLAENIHAIRTYLEIKSSDIAMCVLPFFYSYGNSILHTHLLSGSTIILENSLMYPHKVLENMVDNEVTTFYGVPSTYYLLLARTDLSNYNLSHLRFCAQAGGHMDPAKIDLFKKFLPGSQFFIMYGQTEASSRISYLPPENYNTKKGSVGIPIPGVQLSVRKENEEECLTKEKGEVCVRGPNVMLGYYKDGKGTDKVIHKGWLRTGDLGYLDESGYLYLVGRKSEMIKTGAHRVSPKEIEEVVASVDGVLEVAVIPVADEILGSVVGCCVVGNNDRTRQEKIRKDILFTCKQRFPMYKIPKQIYFLDALPKTASGKIKKHELIQ